MVAQDVDLAKSGVSQSPDEVFTEEYVTGDGGMKEYDYSYKDFMEPGPDGNGGTPDSDIGPALSAVTDEGGVSYSASCQTSISVSEEAELGFASEECITCRHACIIACVCIWLQKSGPTTGLKVGMSVTFCNIKELIWLQNTNAPV